MADVLGGSGGDKFHSSPFKSLIFIVSVDLERIWVQAYIGKCSRSNPILVEFVPS